MKTLINFIYCNRILKFGAIIILTFTLIFGNIPISAIAVTQETEYEEFSDQVTFDYLSVYVVNKENLVVEVDSSISLFKKNEAKKQKEKYEKYIEKHPEGIEEVRNAVNSSEFLCAISYSDAPVVFVDDHYERIKKEKISRNLFTLTANALENEASPSYEANERFSLKTIISRAGKSNPYVYIAQTIGTWENIISIVSGKNKPAAGGDFVVQTCPITISSSDFFSEYNYATNGSKEGQNGINFFERDGDDAWTKYEVYDDPLGLAQLSNFICIQSFEAKATSDTKRVHSQYVHTWKAMTVDVSFAFTVAESGGTPALVPLPILNPSIEDKQWQLHNSVSYNW